MWLADGDSLMCYIVRMSPINEMTLGWGEALRLEGVPGE